MYHHQVLFYELHRCVKENFGYVGCSRDVLEHLDALCSGRKLCKVRVLDETFSGIKPCHDDLKSYLQAQYSCRKGKVNLRQLFYQYVMIKDIWYNQQRRHGNVASLESVCR